jgi:large subunit ribosomal protein L4
MKLPVYNLKRETSARSSSTTRSLASPVKDALFYEVVKAQLASRRAGTKATKERSAVAGSSKKLYKQKGTGNALVRAHPRAAPRGRRHAHALEPKDWSYRPPRKVRLGALRSALSLFAKENRLIVVDAFDLAEIKTKGVVSALSALKADKKALVVDAEGQREAREVVAQPGRHHLPPAGGRQRVRPPPPRHLVVSTPSDREPRAPWRSAPAGRRKGHGRCNSSILRSGRSSSRRRRRRSRAAQQGVFEVDKDANKIQIKDAVETALQREGHGRRTP